MAGTLLSRIAVVSIRPAVHPIITISLKRRPGFEYIPNASGELCGKCALSQCAGEPRAQSPRGSPPWALCYFPAMPDIATTRLLLRPISADDFEAHARITSDAEV